MGGTYHSQPQLFDLPLEHTGEPDEHESTSALAPLAARMRPRTLDEVVGQSALLGPGKFSGA